MFEQYSDRARRIVSLAREEAIGLNHSYIGTEHLLLGLLREGTGAIGALLSTWRVDPDAIRDWVSGSFESDEIVDASGQLPFTPRAEHALNLACQAARRLGSKAVGSEHLLLALLGEADGVAAQVLSDSGIVVEEFRGLVEERLSTSGTFDFQEEESHREGGGDDEVLDLYRSAGLPVPPRVAEYAEKCRRLTFLIAEVERIKSSKWQAVEEELYERAARLKDDLDGLIDERDRLAREVEKPSGVVPKAESLLLAQNRRIIELLAAILDRIDDRD